MPGLPSTNAFPPSRRIATSTGPAVQRLLDAGAIVIGKTNMDQLAIGLVGVRSPYGVARNAFDAAFVPGGSSAGSGVAVGAGLVSFALGNDAAGSGRVPAAFNNVVGVKPTPGLVSNTAVVGGGTAKSLETISVFALTVDDGMHVLRLIAGYDPDDLFSKTEARFCDLGPQPAPARFRFAVPSARDLVFFGDGDAERLFEAAIARLESLGGTAVEVDYAVFMQAQRLLYEAPFLAERNVSVEAMIAGHEDALHPATRTILASARDWTARDAYRAIHRLAELKRDARRLLAGTDVFVVPDHADHLPRRRGRGRADPAQRPPRHLHQLRQPDGPVRHRRSIRLPRATACRSASPCWQRPSPRPRRPPSPTPSIARPTSRSAPQAFRIRGEGGPSRRYARNLALTTHSSAKAHEDPDRVGRWRHVHRQHRLRFRVAADQRLQGADDAAGARGGHRREPASDA